MLNFAKEHNPEQIPSFSQPRLLFPPALP